MQQFKTLNVTLAPSGICHVELNRPKRLNAMSTEFVRIQAIRSKCSSTPEIS
jgi:hypothetical protein